MVTTSYMNASDLSIGTVSLGLEGICSQRVLYIKITVCVPNFIS